MKRFSLRIILVVLLMIGSTFAAKIFAQDVASNALISQSAASLSFNEVYQKVSAYYPRLKSQHAKVEEAIASKFEAYSALLPKVEGLSSVTRGEDPVYVFGSLLREERFSQNNFELRNLNQPKPWTNFNWTLHAEMPLFNAFQTISQIRAARSMEKSAKQIEVWTRMEASLLSIEAYLKVCMLKANQQWTRDMVEAASSDLKQANELKEQGMVLGADFYAAKVILGATKQADFETSMDQKAATALLNILMGGDAKDALSLSGKMSDSLEESEDLEFWLAEAESKRPDLRSFEAQVAAKKASTFAEKMSVLPKVGAFADLTEDSHDFKNGGENYLMGIQGRMDLLDPSYFARRKKAQASFDSLRAEFESYKDQVAKDVSRAFYGYQAVRENLPIAAEAYQDAGEAMKQTEILYREGRKSIADLLEMRQVFLGAVFKRNLLFFQNEMAYANLLFLSGSLDETALKEIAKRIDGVV